MRVNATTGGRLCLAALLAALTATLSAVAEDLGIPVAITNVTAVVAPGEVIQGATILIDGDRIAAVGRSVDIPDYAERVDGSGLWAYSGFIDAATHLGIKSDAPSADELARLRDDEKDVAQGPRTHMQNANRQGVWPHLTIFDLYEQDDKALKAHRKTGFTTALVSPRPAILGGQGGLVELSGHPIRSATIAPSLTQIVSLRPNFDAGAVRTRGYPGSPMGVFALIRQTYLDAEWYRQRHAQYQRYPDKVDRVVVDPVLESMGPLLDRREMWLVEANEPNEIHHALDLAGELNQRVAILGGKEAWKVADRLAAEQVPVVVSLDWPKKPELAPKQDKKKKTTEYTTVSWTPEWENDVFEPVEVREARVREWEDHVNNLHALIKAGVAVAVTSRDAKDAETFWKRVGDALELDLTEDELLGALTTGPAALFDLQDRLGRIAPGNLANVTLRTKPLEDKEGQARYVFIDGERFTFPVTTETEDDAGDEENGDQAKTADEQEAESAAPENRHHWTAEFPGDRDKPMETGGDVVLRHAKVLTVTNGTLDNTDVLVINGRIRNIGRDIPAPAGTAELDLTGYWLMPGIIDPHSHMAITGVNEWTQSITCEVRMSDVVDSRQQAVHRALAGGVTTIHAMHGSANTIGGQNVVLKLKFRTSPTTMRVLTGPRIVKFALGENVTRSRPSPRFPNTRMGVESVLRQAFNDAIAYGDEWQAYAEATSRGEVAGIPRRDLRLEALRDILAGDIWVHSHCYRADEILRLLAVAEDYGFRVATLQHVLEGYRITPEMYTHGVAGSTFSDWWSYKKEAYDAIPYNAAMMMRAGIVASLNSDSSEVIRHLNLEAGKTLRYGGLTADEALRLITINPAIQLGIETRVGSIEVGKDGDFAVFTRHPLDTFARNVLTIVEGEVYFEYPGYTFDGSQTGPALDDVPTPARDVLHLERLEPASAYALVGATVHPVAGPTVDNGVIVIRDGRIEAVGAGIDPPTDAEVIDVTGLHVYPGLINAASQLGLIEIEGMEQTVDAREIAQFQPDLRALSAINPHSEHLPVSYCEGVTTTNVVPTGGVISGRGAFVQLHGWTLPEMLRKDETGLVIDLPTLPKNIEDEEQRKKRIDEHQKAVEKIEAFMREAQHYVKARALPGAPVEPDVRLEAMAPYVRGEKPVFFRADSYKAILEAINFAEVFKLKPIILGGGEAWKCADLLAEKHIPVIVTSVFDRPIDRYDPFDAFYANPAKLEAAGVLFCIATSGAEFARQLPTHAGYAVAYGLSEPAGIRAITLNAAEVLGVDDEVGSLEVGKRADVIVTTGDPLQASTRTIGMFMNGEPIELTSLHERNYQKFLHRPWPKTLHDPGELHGPPPMRVQGYQRPDTD